MRILFLDHATAYGGRQVMAERMLPLLRDRGFDIDSLVGCERLEGGPIPTTYGGLRRAMAGYDLVYANSPRTAIAASTQRTPYLWHKHDVPLTWATRIAARRARAVVSVCRAGSPAGDHVHVIRNGVPSMDAAPATDLPPGPKILVLGRVQPEKGHDVVLDALSRLTKPATLVVAGPGEWPFAKRDDVRFLGLRHDVAALMQACDVVILASRIPEACPLVVLEAQAAGVPVVATRVGGVPEIVVEDETALLVEPEDASALAAAIDHALGVDRDEWGARARKHAAQFTLPACVDRFAEVLLGCLDPVAQ
ncbi:MAG: glycosyltransferase family 4 protein [Planctomycetota bacterium]